MSGSMRQVEPGVWSLEVAAGRDPVTRKRARLYATVHGGKRQAATALAALVTEADTRRQADTSGTFGYLLAEWLRRVERDREETTAIAYRRIVEKTVAPALGDVPLRKLTERHLDQLYDAELARGASPMTVGQVHKVCRAALNFAVRWRWVDQNVALIASPPPKRPREIIPPTVPVMLAVLAAADELDPDFGMLCRIAAATGARRGELCALRWTDVEPDRRRIMIRHAVATIADRTATPAANGRRPQRVIVKDTKSHQQRAVGVDDGTLILLAGHRGRVEERAALDSPHGLVPDAFVFSRQPDGSEPLRPASITSTFARARARAGHPGATLKGFRHLAASVQLAAGVPLANVSGNLGHSSNAITLSFYIHAMPDERGSADVMGRLFGSQPPIPVAAGEWVTAVLPPVPSPGG